MSKKALKLNRNEYVNRRFKENVEFPELRIRLGTIDSVLLLLDSNEEMVLIESMKHITEFIRRSDENVAVLKEKNVLGLMQYKSFYRTHPNVLVKRFCLYVSSFIVENSNCLVEVESKDIFEIIRECIAFYLSNDDDFCCEYLSVILNRCLNDPQAVAMILGESEFLRKFFTTTAMSSNPDVLLNSFEMLHKMLLLQAIEDRNDFISQTIFPIDRVLCELQCEFFEIRRACLKVLHTLIATQLGLDHPLQRKARAVLLVEKLTKVYCEAQSNPELCLVLEVMTAAMDHQEMAALFFEMNLFEKYLSRLNSGSFEPEMKCKSLMVLAECAKYVKFVARLVNSNLTESLLQCLLTTASPPAYLLQGLNRLTESSEACNRILEAYDLGLLSKLLRMLPDFEIDIKSREQASMLLQNLLSFSFHPTANAVLELNLPAILSQIFGQLPEQRSIDLMLSGLDVIETLSGNADYRERLCESNSLIENLAVVLMNSFSTAVMVIRLLRCLCCLLDLQCVCLCLLNNYLCPSLKRALQSSSKQVKTAATNFIMQSTRFQVFIKEYVDSGVLETLIFNQKHALFVPTWAAAIDSILSKAPTWKFCIRNHLNFTDITFCGDFFVSTKRFDDFRILVTILREEVSPLQPVLLMNFNRCVPAEETIRRVPCIGKENEKEKEWCYCRLPGDKFLPTYLEELNNMLDNLGLAANPPKINRRIDFENLAARAKVIASVVDKALGSNLKKLDLNSKEECSQQAVMCHLKDLSKELHCSIIPVGRIQMGCQFERAVLFKGLADQVGLPCTLQRSVDGNMLFNEVPLPVDLDQDEHCEKRTMDFMPWRMLRPTHVVDLMYNVGELYPLQSRQALQYLRLY